MKKRMNTIILILIAAFLIIQLVPYGRDHTNPPVVKEPNWDSPRTRELARTACFDCHSNESTWPWYTNVAPFSWLAQNDVEEGRAKLNFSDWGKGEEDPYEAIEVIQEGEMPPTLYLITHPQARLSQAEKDELIAGLRATIANP